VGEGSTFNFKHSQAEGMAICRHNGREDKKTLLTSELRPVLERHKVGPIAEALAL
jgi:hypothetical protein